MPGPAGRADAADHAEDQVLGIHTDRRLAGDGDPHGFRSALEQRLRGEHVLDLAGADPESERAERAMGRGVTVAADDRRAGQREPLFGTDDVHDSLPSIQQRQIRDRELPDIVLERGNLQASGFVRNSANPAFGRNVVIGDRQRQFRAPDRSPGRAEALESLRTGDFVNEMAVDVEQRDSVVAGLDHVTIPDFRKQGLRTGGGHGRRQSSTAGAVFAARPGAVRRRSRIRADFPERSRR